MASVVAFLRRKVIFVYFYSQTKIRFEQIKTNRKCSGNNLGFVDSGLGICSDEQANYLIPMFEFGLQNHRQGQGGLKCYQYVTQRILKTSLF